MTDHGRPPIAAELTLPWPHRQGESTTRRDGELHAAMVELERLRWQYEAGVIERGGYRPNKVASWVADLILGGGR